MAVINIQNVWSITRTVDGFKLVSAGSQGPIGPAGPNEISTSTETTLEGLILGNGETIEALAVGAANTYLKSDGTNLSWASVDLSNYQPLNNNLTAISALTTQTFGLSLLTAANAAAGRALLVAARTDGANTFTGAQTFSDGILLAQGQYIKHSTATTTGMVFNNTQILLVSSGNVLCDINPSGLVNVPFSFSAGGSNSAVTPVTIKGASGQVEPLLELQDSLGATSLEFGPTSLIKSITGDLNFDSAATGNINFKYLSSLTMLSLGSSGAVFFDSNATYALQNYNQAGTVGWMQNSAGSILGNTYHQKWTSANLWYNGSVHVGLVPNSSGVLRVSDGGAGLGSMSLASLTATGQIATSYSVASSGGGVSITNPDASGYSDIRFVGATVLMGYGGASSAAANLGYIATNGKSFTLSTDLFSTTTLFAEVNTRKVGINTATPTAQFQVNVANSGYVGQILNLASGQTANAFEVRDSLSAIVTSILANGDISSGSLKYYIGKRPNDNYQGIWLSSNGQSRTDSNYKILDDNGFTFFGGATGLAFLVGGSRILNVNGSNQLYLGDGNTGDTGSMVSATSGSGGLHSLSVVAHASQSVRVFTVKTNGLATLFGVNTDGGIQTSTTASATTLGTVAAKMPIYNAAGTLVGYVPLYDAIT